LRRLGAFNNLNRQSLWGYKFHFNLLIFFTEEFVVFKHLFAVGGLE